MIPLRYGADYVYWRKAGVGWVTGHSYLVYDTLADASAVDGLNRLYDEEEA